MAIDAWPRRGCARRPRSSRVALPPIAQRLDAGRCGASGCQGAVLAQNIKSNSAYFGKLGANSGPGARFGPVVCPTRTQFDRHFPMSGNIGHKSAELGQDWPKFYQHRPNLGRDLHSLGSLSVNVCRACPNAASLGQRWSNFDPRRSWPPPGQLLDNIGGEFSAASDLAGFAGRHVRERMAPGNSILSATIGLYEAAGLTTDGTDLGPIQCCQACGCTTKMSKLLGAKVNIEMLGRAWHGEWEEHTPLAVSNIVAKLPGKRSVCVLCRGQPGCWVKLRAIRLCMYTCIHANTSVCSCTCTCVPEYVNNMFT